MDYQIEHKKHCPKYWVDGGMVRSQIAKPDTFLYFAYGGDLWKTRIHMHSPSAELVSIGRLDNYRLDFIKYSKFWGGPSATIVPTANAHTWGAIWRIHKDDKESLDDQYGIEAKKYFTRYVEILTSYMGYFTCLVYEQKVNPLPRGDNDPIPVERWPSETGKKVMIAGAQQIRLPDCYIELLKALPHNGEEGCLRMVMLLMRYAHDRPCQCRVPGRIPRKPLKLDPKTCEGKPKKQTPRKTK